ncbi:hypothetical protein NP233_g8998 [Leucocoprinus birnbaumii]|uniref:Gamma-butyrobetaine dioxygenase n=1 Tax=Leucocoprinus birnbaumii TaxID=56174 RepID=A0AAD5VLD0_9AGAR|nr:hypothetical protein NP233_g8998 [Leucocoprinus birnbaumii]
MLIREGSNAFNRAFRRLNFLTRSWSSITPTQTGVTIHALNDTTFPYVWLRDSCQSPTCIHASTRQKLHRTSDIAYDIKPASLSSSTIRLNGQEELEIEWSDGHKSVFPRSFLEMHSDRGKLHDYHCDVTEEAWNNHSIQRSELFIPYEEIRTSTGLLKGITQLRKFGLLFVNGVPNEKTSNDECELKKLGEMFGEIRPTFYGLLWDVVNLKTESKNIAYTNLDLGLHMDLLWVVRFVETSVPNIVFCRYFQHPPRYQILHCLRNRVVGGTSIFVDALAVAEKLRQSHPDYFNVLTTSPVAFHYINDGHHLHYEHPTIELAPSISSTPTSPTDRRIGHINYSPPFQAPLPLDTPPEFYPALREFSQLLNNPMNTYQYTLREGDAVLFDNRRALHARTAFREREDAENMTKGEANRWLKGCYLEADAIMDRGRVLRKKLGF